MWMVTFALAVPARSAMAPALWSRNRFRASIVSLGIATFYRGFSLKPVGRHRIHVCMGTACHVQGAPRLLDAVSRELGIQKGETTPDMEFSLDTVNCLGCCGLAPVITVGTDVHGKLKQTGIPRMLRRYVKDYKAKTH
jgi:NADH:ubiquinone oxidoreductase subunit E